MAPLAVQGILVPFWTYWGIKFSLTVNKDTAAPLVCNLLGVGMLRGLLSVAGAPQKRLYWTQSVSLIGLKALPLSDLLLSTWCIADKLTVLTTVLGQGFALVTLIKFSSAWCISKAASWSAAVQSKCQQVRSSGIATSIIVTQGKNLSSVGVTHPKACKITPIGASSPAA